MPPYPPPTTHRHHVLVDIYEHVDRRKSLSPTDLRCGVFQLYGPAHVYSVLLVKWWAGKAFPIGSLRDGRIVPKAGRRIHKRGAKVASRSPLSRAVAGASPTGSNPAAKGAYGASALGDLEALSRANLRAPSGAWRRRNPPFGFMAAQPVTRVSAGYVNSGQHVIRGRFTPFRSLGWVKYP